MVYKIPGKGPLGQGVQAGCDGKGALKNERRQTNSGAGSSVQGGFKK